MRKALSTSIFLILFFCFSFCFAQTSPTVSSVKTEILTNAEQLPKCISDIMQSELYKKNPALISKQKEIDDLLYNRAISRERGTANNTFASIINIPVVVHVVHNNGPENIPDAQIIQGIQDLNDAFSNSGAYFNINGVATGIQFCLAQQDFFGYPANGITRTQSPLTNMNAETDDQLLKTIDRWDPQKFLNIWLVNEITSMSMGNVAGYAYFPSSHGGLEDGIVNEARWFGSSHDNSKVHIHEAGHYLGLYHTFNDGCINNDCFANGDRVCDTPPDNSTLPVFCNSTANTCSSDEDDHSLNNPFRPVSLGGLGDQPDMFQNYMDYGLQACQSSFTEGQKNRMLDAVNNVRTSLLNSKGCTPSCGPIFAHINYMIQPFTVNVPFTMLNQTNGSVPYSFEWFIDNVSVSTDTILTTTISTAGYHTIVLRAYNIGGGCYVSDSVRLKFECDVESKFSYTPSVINPGSPVTFTASTINAITYKWIVDGAFASVGPTFNQGFLAGRHSAYLISSSLGCSDTSEISFLPVGECADGSANNWVTPWGNLLNFTTDTPAVSVISSQSHFGFEGVATISDRNGKFLFNTDGITIFNTEHDTMMNGDSLFAGGSSSQAVMIVPNPAHSNLYYVFTTDDFAGLQAVFNHGGYLAYSIVDMDLDSGRGAVTEKNVLLMTPTCEKLTGTYSCDGQSIWVISHEYPTDAFYCYQVSANGVDTVPVISHVGTSLQPGAQGMIGCMKASPKGNRIASATRDGYTEVFDFDNNTGIVSNPVKIFSENYWGPYGVEFSPDGSKLYVSNVYDGYAQNEIYQYDLSSGIESMIRNSETMIGTSSSVWRAGSLQAAPNGRIYSIDCSDYFIDEISNPDAKGMACNFKQKAIAVPALMNGFGLPNFVAHNDQTYTPKITGPLTVCGTADTITYKINCSGGNVLWTHKGPNQVVSSDPVSLTMNFTLPGIDTIIVSGLSPCNTFVADTAIIHSSPVNISLGNDTSICSTGNIFLSPGAGYVSYLWSDGSNASKLKVSTDGDYAVTVTGVGGCSDSDTIHVSTFPSTLQIDLGPDLITCSSQNTMLIPAPPGNFTHYLWSDGTTNDTLRIYFEQHVVLTVTDVQGCVATDEMDVIKQDSIIVNLGNDLTICDGKIIILQPADTLNGYTYQWQDGSTLPTFTAHNAGKYWVTVGINNCFYFGHDTVELISYGSPLVNLGADTVVCPNVSFDLHAGSGHENYLWQDGSDDSTFTVLGGGIYWVVVSDSGCYTLDSISVEGCVGLNQNNVNAELLIYPNPSNGIFEMEFADGRNFKNGTQLEIVNAIGEIMERKTINESAKQKIDLSYLSNGMYLVKIISEDEIGLYRMMIQK